MFTLGLSARPKAAYFPQKRRQCEKFGQKTAKAVRKYVIKHYFRRFFKKLRGGLPDQTPTLVGGDTPRRSMRSSGEIVADVWLVCRVTQLA